VAALSGGTLLIGNLGGRTLAPGTYRFSSSAQLTGTLSLAGTGSPYDAWYFQIGTTLITSVGSAVILTGGGLPCNVYWQVGSSATLGIATAFTGTILAQVSVTLNGIATSNGGIFALGGYVYPLFFIFVLFKSFLRAGFSSLGMSLEERAIKHHFNSQIAC
jgi:hypothetical protein